LAVTFVENILEPYTYYTVFTIHIVYFSGKRSPQLRGFLSKLELWSFLVYGKVERMAYPVD
jgi:hypothetical protein